MDLLHTAAEHNLKRLVKHSITKASKIPRINCYADFDELEHSTKMKIMHAMEIENNLNNNSIKTCDFVKEGSESEEDETDGYNYDADSESEQSDRTD